MTGHQDRAPVRAQLADPGPHLVVGQLPAGTVVWTVTGRAAGERTDGPHTDHLAALLRRQRRRQALRRGILWSGSWLRARRRARAVGTLLPTPANTLPGPRRPLDDVELDSWSWLGDGEERRLLAARHRAGGVTPEVLDLRERPWRRPGDPAPDRGQGGDGEP